MANSTKPTTAILIQVSAALALFLAVCMARNIANHELLISTTTSDLIKPRILAFPGFLGMLATAPSAEPENPEPKTSGCSKAYRVMKGETCYSTWMKFNVKEKTFYALNPSIDCNNLDIGQTLCIAGNAN